MNRRVFIPALLTLLTLSVSLSAQDNDHLTLLARWASGPCRSVVVTLDALFMGNGSYLDILNPNNTDQRYSRYEFPGLIQDIYYESFKIYVAVQQHGVYILDRSNISYPSLDGRFSTQGAARRLAYQNGFVYLADGNSGFSIFRTSDFEPFGHLQFSSPVQDVAVSGDIAYLAVDALGLVTVDISNPAGPAILDTADTPGSAYALSHRGEQVFVADRSQGVWVIDVANASNLSVAGQWTVEPGEVTFSDISVLADGETAYLSDEGYGLRVIDLTSMTEKTQLNTQGDAYSLFIDQDYVYLADGASGLKKIDVAKTPPDQISSVNAGGNAKDVILTQASTFVAAGKEGVRILNSTSLHDGIVSLRVQWDTEDARNLALYKNVLLIADGPGGLLMYNVQNPGSPLLIPIVNSGNDTWDVTVVGDSAYAAEGTAGIRIVDLSNVEEPVDRGLIEGISGFTAVGVTADKRSGRLYIAARENGMKVLNLLTNTIVGTYQNDSQIQAIGVPWAGSSIVYAADGANGVKGLNVSNLENITISSQINTSGFAYNVGFYGETAVVADGAGTIRLLDISSQNSMSETGSYHTAGTSYNVDITGDTLAIADGEGGVYFLTVDLTGELQVVTDSLLFENVVLGKNRSMYMRVANTGSAPVYVNEYSANTSRFYISGLPHTISAGDTSYLAVTFVPNSYSTVQDTLRLYSDAANSPHLIPVKGTGVEATALSAYTPDYFTYSLYHMDALEGSTLPDASNLGYFDGVVTGALISEANGGQFSQGLVFDSNDIVRVDMESFGLYSEETQQQGFTIETWFKINEMPKGKAVIYQLISGQEMFLELALNGNRLMGLTRNRESGVDTLGSDSEYPLVTGKWYHGALTIGEDINLYLNGNLEDSHDNRLREPAGAMSAVIGNDTLLEYPFRGVLDEMRMSAIARQPWEFNVNTGRIQVYNNALHFGSVYVGKSKYYYLSIYNTGAGPLSVTDMYTATDQFDVYETDFTIASSGYRTIYLRFTPEAAQVYRDTLTILSQDLMTPVLRIPLSGSGFQSVTIGPYTTDTYTSGLWHLDGTAGMDSIPDASGTGLVGYFRGSGITWDAIYKKYGISALRFNGTSGWINLPYHALFNYTTSPFSMETWFNLSGKPAANKDYVLFRRGTGSALQYEILYGDTLTPGRGLIFRFYDSNNVSHTLYGPADSGMNLSQWYQLAVTWDKSKVRLYMNGTAVDSLEFTGAFRSSTADLAMGGDYGTGRFFNGLLDEIRFSSIDRQPEEFNVGIPNIYIPPVTMNFDTVLVGSSLQKSFAISNIGAIALSIDSMKTSSGVFFVTPAHDTLISNETINVSVTFMPETTGLILDTLKIYSNDPDSPLRWVALHGFGIDYRPKEPYEEDAYTLALYHCDGTDATVANAVVGSAFPGVLSSAAARTPQGYFSRALRLNGQTDYMEVADDTTLQFDMSKKSFTIECFFKTDTVDQVIFYKDPYQGVGTNRSNYGLSINAEGHLFLHGFGTGSTFVSDNGWHHAAFVYQAGTGQGILYLDGAVELQQTWQTGNTDIISPGRLLFGARELLANQMTGFFQGDLDEIRISSIARPPWDLIFKTTGIAVTLNTVPVKGVQQQIDITIPVLDNTAREISLYYRQGGQSVYQSIQAAVVEGDASHYTAMIPANNVTERGLEYYVELITAQKTLTHPLYDPINRPLTSIVRFNTLAPDTTLPKLKYTMISVPANLNAAVAGDVLVDDLGNYDPYKWRCLAWKDTVYQEYGDTLTYGDSLLFSMNPGRAFWLISDTQKSWDTGTGYSVATNGPFTFTVRPQWNMIGSPFAFPVAWNDCALSSDSLETLYYYDGKGYRLDWPVLDPWGGYWMYNAGTDYHEFYVPPKEQTVLAKSAPVRGGVISSLAEEDWIWQISARSEDAQDLDNYLGVRQDSRTEWDLRDRVEPPPMGDYISVYFDHSEWKKHPGTYAADIRKPDTGGMSWDLMIETRLKQQLVKLNWSLLQNMPEGWQIIFLDMENGLTVDMAAQDSYAMITEETVPNVKMLKCVAGPPEYVENALSDAKAPLTFHLFQNYPNPFNPSTGIKYSIPKNGHVRLSIFNMLGQRVALLADSEQSPGEYVTRWDGLSDRGVSLSSGVYFYKLEFPGRVAIRKMILVR